VFAVRGVVDQGAVTRVMGNGRWCTGGGMGVVVLTMAVRAQVPREDHRRGDHDRGFGHDLDGGLGLVVFLAVAVAVAMWSGQGRCHAVIGVAVAGVMAGRPGVMLAVIAVMVSVRRGGRSGLDVVMQARPGGQSRDMGLAVVFAVLMLVVVVVVVAVLMPFRLRRRRRGRCWCRCREQRGQRGQVIGLVVSAVRQQGRQPRPVIVLAPGLTWVLVVAVVTAVVTAVRTAVRIVVRLW
jgi:hypothetical protein